MTEQKIMTTDDIISRFDALIVDVDGTLYHLLPLRAGMAIRLTFDLLRHPGDLPLFRALLYFRKIRKKPEYINTGMEEQLRCSAGKFKRSYEQTYEYISRWLFVEPIRVIPTHKDNAIVGFVNDLKKTGKKIVIYSDYPADDKLGVLGVTYDHVFYPGSGIPDVLKPSSEAMKTILDSVGADPERVLYIGDDDTKDGASARIAGTAYLNVRALRKIIGSSGRKKA